MEEENGGISFKEIFRIIMTQKWLALAIAFLITIVGTLALHYGYNPSQTDYVAQFSLNLPGDNSGSVYRYPDGNIFYYTDIVSYNTLEKIKNSADDGSFANIAVSNMTDKGKISITREFVSLGEGENALSEPIYTVTVKASFFDSKEQAKRFISAIANVPALYVSDMNIDYDVYLSVSESAEDYDKEIAYLKNQVDLLKNYYSSLVNTYGGSFVVRGKTLSSYAEKVNAYANSGTLDNLLAEARKEKYLKSEELRASYALEIDTLKQEYEVEKAALDALLNVNGNVSGGSAVIGDASVVRDQARIVATLDQQIKVMETYMTEGTVNTEFAQKIKTAYDTISSFTNDYSNISKGVYTAATSVKFSNANIVTERGGISFILLAMFSLILGVLVACAVAYGVGYAAIKKAEKKAAAEDTGEKIVETKEETEEKPSEE